MELSREEPSSKGRETDVSPIALYPMESGRKSSQWNGRQAALGAAAP